MRFSPTFKRYFFGFLQLLAVAAAAAILAFTIINGRQFFTRRAIRQESTLINSFGVLSPLAVAALIILSTLIPPLPIPTPLVELAAGLIFGFGPGFLVVWISQIISSLLAFGTTRFFGNRFFKSILNRPTWKSYRGYLEHRGPTAVFLIRAAIAAPFNIVSFLAGLTDMNVWKFAVATALGTIPESVLFTLIGSEIRTVRVRLVYFYAFLIGVELIGFVFTAIFLQSVEPYGKKEKKN